MNTSRWLNWRPKEAILRELPCREPTKPSKPPSVGCVGSCSAEAPDIRPLEAVLKGRAIELWSDALGERFWLVADEEDAALLGERRGSIYTAAEARLVVQVSDRSAVAEVHRWKQRFNGSICDVVTKRGPTRK
jgi:hypothetical protein